MEIRKSSLDVMFEGRIEEIARLTIPEKNRLLKIEEIKSIEDYIEDLSEEQEQQAKEFIDDLRCKNGNLKIILTHPIDNNEL